MLTVTKPAQHRILEVLKEEPGGSKLRVFVSGGGCSGFSYGFSVETNQEENDTEILAEEISIVIDNESLKYLKDAEIDFKDDLSGARFIMTNPNAKSGCSCGSSFSC